MGSSGALGCVLDMWDTRVFDTEEVSEGLYSVLLSFRGLMLMRVEVDCRRSWLG